MSHQFDEPNDQDPREAREQQQMHDMGKKIAEIAESSNRAGPPDALKLDFSIGEHMFTVRLTKEKRILFTATPNGGMKLEEFDTLIQTLDHVASMAEPGSHSRLKELVEGFAKSIGKGIVEGTDPDAGAPWKQKT